MTVSDVAGFPLSVDNHRTTKKEYTPMAKCPHNSKLEYEKLKKVTTKALHDESLPQEVRDALYTWRDIFHGVRFERDDLRHAFEEYMIADAQSKPTKKSFRNRVENVLYALFGWLLP